LVYNSKVISVMAFRIETAAERLEWYKFSAEQEKIAYQQQSANTYPIRSSEDYEKHNLYEITAENIGPWTNNPWDLVPAKTKLLPPKLGPTEKVAFIPYNGNTPQGRSHENYISDSGIPGPNQFSLKLLNYFTRTPGSRKTWPYWRDYKDPEPVRPNPGHYYLENSGRAGSFSTLGEALQYINHFQFRFSFKTATYRKYRGF